MLSVTALSTKEWDRREDSLSFLELATSAHYASLLATVGALDEGPCSLVPQACAGKLML